MSRCVAPALVLAIACGASPTPSSPATAPSLATVEPSEEPVELRTVDGPLPDGLELPDQTHVFSSGRVALYDEGECWHPSMERNPFEGGEQ